MNEVNGHSKNGLPDDWKWKTLDEIGIPNNSSILPSKYGNEIFEVWSVPNFDKGEPEYLKGSEIGSNKIFVQEGDVLLCKINPRINRVWKVRQARGFKQIASTEWIVVRNQDINTSFLLYQLQSQKIRNELLKDVSGVGGSLMRARPNAVKKLKLSIPPRQTQDNIVSKIEELFSELDKNVEQLKTTQQQLKVYRQSVLKWAFEGRLTNENVNGELPKTWKWVNIDFLLSDLKKGMTTGPFGTMLKKSEHQVEGIAVLGIENIGEGTFKMPNKIFITKGKATELKNFQVNESDIIISRSGTVGEICLVPSRMKNSIISTNLIKVSLNQSVINPKYFVYLFQGGRVREKVFDLCKGSSRAFLNQTILKALDFPYCELGEQDKVIQEIESRLSVADKLEETITNSLQQAEALRQSILKKAFDGSLT